jgi:uncharacterized membrane protein YdbT with pleckstrin-like domain
MSDTTTIIILLVLIFLCLLMFVWYVSDMFTLLRYKTDVLEQQNAELMRRQTRNYEWFIKIARGDKCDT